MNDSLQLGGSGCGCSARRSSNATLAVPHAALLAFGATSWLTCTCRLHHPHQLTRSCTSSPSCQPTELARLSRAEGADQPPSAVRATTKPLPTLKLHPAPTRATDSTASPAAPRRMAGGMVRSGGSEPTAAGWLWRQG